MLRPLIAQLIRATHALDSHDEKQIRYEAARAYYRLGELFEQEKQLVTNKDLRQIHRILDQLFQQSIELQHIEKARILFRSYLFQIESSQPSSLSLAEMLQLSVFLTPDLNLYELVIVRVAHCARKASLALLAGQPDLACAYLEFLAVDAPEIARSHPEILTDTMLQILQKTYDGLQSRTIKQGNCRPAGQELRDTLKPLQAYADRITASRARETRGRDHE